MLTLNSRGTGRKKDIFISDTDDSVKIDNLVRNQINLFVIVRCGYKVRVYWPSSQGSLLERSYAGRKAEGNKERKIISVTRFHLT